MYIVENLRKLLCQQKHWLMEKRLFLLTYYQSVANSHKVKDAFYETSSFYVF